MNIALWKAKREKETQGGEFKRFSPGMFLFGYSQLATIVLSFKTVVIEVSRSQATIHLTSSRLLRISLPDNLPD